MFDHATLVIHHQRIELNDDADPRGILEEILAGVRSGGAVVRVSSRYGSSYDFVVTASTQAYTYRGAVPGGDHAHDGPWLSGFSLDY